MDAYGGTIPFVADKKDSSANKKAVSAKNIPLIIRRDDLICLPDFKLKEAAINIKQHIMRGLLINLYKKEMCFNVE